MWVWPVQITPPPLGLHQVSLHLVVWVVWVCGLVGTTMGKEGKDMGKEGKDMGKEGKDMGKEGKDMGKEGKDEEKDMGKDEEKDMGKEGKEERIWEDMGEGGKVKWNSSPS